MSRLLSTFLAAALAASIASGCATRFHGSTHITPADCHASCTSIGGVMAAYVFMGRYSTACVCEPPRQRADASSGSVGGAAGAVAGVWMQMQAEDEAR